MIGGHRARGGPVGIRGIIGILSGIASRGKERGRVESGTHDTGIRINKYEVLT